VVEGSVLERSWSPERSPGLSRSPDLKVSLFTDHTAYDTLPNRDVGRTRHSALCRDVPREDAHDDAGAMSESRPLTPRLPASRRLLEVPCAAGATSRG
jgi:hypothetical protein